MDPEKEAEKLRKGREARAIRASNCYTNTDAETRNKVDVFCDKLAAVDFRHEKLLRLKKM